MNADRIEVVEVDHLCWSFHELLPPPTFRRCSPVHSPVLNPLSPTVHDEPPVKSETSQTLQEAVITNLYTLDL
jgi:hypothetical protein